MLHDPPTTAAGTVSRLYSKDISRHRPAGHAFVVPCTRNSMMEDDFDDQWYDGGDGRDDIVDDGHDLDDGFSFFLSCLSQKKPRSLRGTP